MVSPLTPASFRFTLTDSFTPSFSVSTQRGTGRHRVDSLGWQTGDVPCMSSTHTSAVVSLPILWMSLGNTSHKLGGHDVLQINLSNQPTPCSRMQQTHVRVISTVPRRRGCPNCPRSPSRSLQEGQGPLLSRFLEGLEMLDQPPLGMEATGTSPGLLSAHSASLLFTDRMGLREKNARSKE